MPQLLEQKIGVVIVPDRAEHGYPAADAGGRAGLICRFASGEYLQRASVHGFAR
jgi:hypothetical protein